MLKFLKSIGLDTAGKSDKTSEDMFSDVSTAFRGCNLIGASTDTDASTADETSIDNNNNNDNIIVLISSSFPKEFLLTI
jgi:hypothetical protein